MRFVIIMQLWACVDHVSSDLHIKASKCIWALLDITEVNEVESIITGYLTGGPLKERMYNLERFSVFWRLSEQVPHSSILLSRPLFIIIGMLKSNVLWEKRFGETFLRCSLKSFVKYSYSFTFTKSNQRT